MFKPVDFRIVSVVMVLSLTVACGGGGMSSPLAPTINVQPSDQSAHVSQTATFTVVASGTSPLAYQWSKNGAAISGATGASYTAQLVAPADNGSLFTVMVTNAAGSITSRAAALTVYPRAPKPGDWRFQGMDLPGGSFAGFFNLFGASQATLTNYLGTPLPMALGVGDICVPGVYNDCSWSYSWYNLPTGTSGLTTIYKADAFANLDADLSALFSPDIVVTSLDLEPETQLFAVSWLQLSQSGGFDLQAQWVAPSDLQAVASQLATQSRIITAVSFNAGQVYVLSYGWQGDTTTKYEVSVMAATGDEYITEAQNLAASGYIITAMGGDPADGLLLVGTRVQGDTMPRPFAYKTPSGTTGKVPVATQTLYRNIYNYGANYNVWLSEQ